MSVITKAVVVIQADLPPHPEDAAICRSQSDALLRG